MTDIVRDVLVARRAIGRDGPYVFPSNSESGHIAEPKSHMRAVAKVTGVHVSPHDLRRTFIGVAESADISAFALKALVNHSPGSDVTSGYLSIGIERLRDPAQRVADRMKALCGIAAPPGVSSVHGAFFK
jgi:integrase